MPILKSSKKALRQNRARRGRNVAQAKAMKEAIKAAVAGGEKLSVAFKLIDKAVKTNLIHHNKAARLKSRLSKLAKSAAVAVKAVQSDKKHVTSDKKKSTKSVKTAKKPVKTAKK